MLAVPVCPSLLVAVTVYVCEPVLDVSSAPGELESFESVHDWIPGPSVPSLHEKPVATISPTA